MPDAAPAEAAVLPRSLSEAALAAAAPPAPLRPLYEAHLAALFDAPATRAAHARHRAAQGLLPLRPGTARRGAAGDALAWVERRASAGLARLDPADQRAYLALTARVLAAMPPRACAEALRDGFAAPLPRATEAQALAALPGDAAAAYLALQRRAFFADLAGGPAPAPLSPDARDRARHLFSAALARAVAAAPDGAALLRAGRSLDGADDSLACRLGQAGLAAATRIPAPGGDLVIRRITGR
jgi:hypothetical protein